MAEILNNPTITGQRVLPPAYAKCSIPEDGDFTVNRTDIRRAQPALNGTQKLLTIGLLLFLQKYGMSRISLCLFVLMALGYPAAQSASDDRDQKSVSIETTPKNCIITTTTEYKDGDVEIMTQAFNFNLKSQCMKTEKLLSKNFDPGRIKKIKSKIDWRGK